MAKYYYIAEAVYSNGEIMSGKEHKDAQRCYEDLRLLMRKATGDGLISIGVNRYEKEKK